jgi:hypothetical protein
MAAKGKSYRPAFPSRSRPDTSIDIPFPAAYAHYITNPFEDSKVYVIVFPSARPTTLLIAKGAR